MIPFETTWRERFGSIPPLGHRLRENFPDQWVRFHSLPKSKRYADNDLERSIILDRANTLAGEIFDVGESFWLAASQADENPEIINYTSTPFTIISRQLPKAFSWVDPTEAPEDRLICSTYSKQVPWKIYEFDDVFMKIADEEDFEIIFSASDLSSILAPYDVGFDIILQDTKKVAELSRKYQNWLSLRTDKL